MLEIKRLSAGYGGKRIIHEISFTLDKGFNVLLGQNGSGKTTIFRALSGALPGTCGEIILEGTDISGLSVKKRAALVSYMNSEHTAMSGIDGMQLAKMAFYPSHGIFYTPGKKEEEFIRRTAEQFDAAALLEKNLNEMSSGERQLSWLIAAICQNTGLMMLDEPTSALDFNRTHDFLSKLQMQKEDKIIFASLHDPGLALEYADRILLLNEGKLCGEIIPKNTDAAEAEEKLRVLYPGIKIYENGGTFCVSACRD